MNDTEQVIAQRYLDRIQEERDAKLDARETIAEYDTFLQTVRKRMELEDEIPARPGIVTQMINFLFG